MGEARRLADTAGAPAPSKQDRLDRKHPLYPLAGARSGTLLWRPDTAVRDDELPEGPTAWREGAEAARAYRLEDASRYNEIQDAARERRKHRR